MIEAVFAQRFIDRVTNYTSYNINIMNEKGVIIASRDSSRVGTFHEVAYRIVNGGDDLVVTTSSDDFPGVLPGINQVIIVDGKREGVVGITGDPEEVKPVALITRMAVESMLKFERQEEAIRLRSGKKEHFFNLLTRIEHSDPNELRAVARELKYTESIVRVPILCRLDATADEQVRNVIKSNPMHSSEDFSFLVDEHHILIYKTLPGKMENLFHKYKKIIKSYLEMPVRMLALNDIKCKFFVGSFQSSFSQYYYSFHHCQWLEDSVDTVKEISFFYDYMNHYIKFIFPQAELQRVFNVYEKEFDDKFKENFIELADALETGGYNLVTTAQILNVHKNTVIYRLKKISDLMGINPLSSASDRSFMLMLSCYLRHLS